ncbi:MAG TPA: UDP-3-O-[3-hydroxymyristoyl] N-acetylglucosamine deacetylase [Nitrospiraceae bacterium]|nr:UDP-3-O-[3-hydroxymyristoyl] N-acetylglucosamine deacetylase [Nitrospiraceae bacterium]
MRLQNTLKDEIFISGQGLHSGRNISMRLRPAPSNTGVVFIRTDKGNVRIKASVSTVSDTTFATTLTSEGVRIGTVEHLLAALAGLNVDNVYVEINGPEVPIMDGSAYAFVSRIMECGIAKQEKAISYIKILAPIVVMEGHSQIAITPYEGTRITYRLFYTHPAFGEQKMGIDISTTTFLNELAPARTFGFLRDVEMLKSRGLAQGGSLDNAIVLGESEVINSNMLRFKDEFVRHKILDAIGDLSLIGLPIYGHIIANKSGHTLHIKLLRKILLLRDSWKIISPSVVTSTASELAAQI